MLTPVTVLDSLHSWNAAGGRCPLGVGGLMCSQGDLCSWPLAGLEHGWWAGFLLTLQGVQETCPVPVTKGQLGFMSAECPFLPQCPKAAETWVTFVYSQVTLVFILLFTFNLTCVGVLLSCVCAHVVLMEATRRQ